MTNPSEPAFPVNPDMILQTNENDWFLGGLTKREYFAGLAMQGLIAGAKPVQINSQPFSIETASVIIADALIAALNKQEKSHG